MKNALPAKLSGTVTRFHRTNQTFADITELIAAMTADEAAARAWFAKRQ